MQRDFDLIRSILLHLEDEPTAHVQLLARDLPEWQAEAVNYHIWLLIQSGLIVGSCNHDYPKGRFMCQAICLTWQGHEFLATIRDEGAWRKIRQILADKSVDLSLEAVTAAASMLLKNLF